MVKDSKKIKKLFLSSIITTQILQLIKKVRNIFPVKNIFRENLSDEAITKIPQYFFFDELNNFPLITIFQ